MDTQKFQIPAHHQAVVDRFVIACETDDRIVAAFLGGSYAREAADDYSDLDLYLITTDQDFDEFYDQRQAFMRLLGEPVFLEEFGIPNIVFYVFVDGTEGELGIGRENDFADIHGGPHVVLVDKKGILAGVAFTFHEADSVEQREKLRRLIFWFWHDFSHFITALGRGQLWWAQGQLEELRRYCVNLARLRNNFADEEVGDEPYFKIEKAMPVDHFSVLESTFAPMEKTALLQAALIILRFYQETARDLAGIHRIAYPEKLEQVMVARLDKLQDLQSG